MKKLKKRVSLVVETNDIHVLISTIRFFNNVGKKISKHDELVRVFLEIDNISNGERDFVEKFFKKELEVECVEINVDDFHFSN